MNNCSLVPNVEYKVKKIIEDHLCVPFVEIKLDSALDKKLGADSLDIIEIIMALEKEFDIELDDKEMDELDTIGDIVEYIKERIK